MDGTDAQHAMMGLPRSMAVWQTYRPAKSESDVLDARGKEGVDLPSMLQMTEHLGS